VKDINPGTPLAFADVGGSLLFFQGLDLWKSDGSAAGTQLVAAGVSPGDSQTTANGLLFFRTGWGAYGGSLGRSDGTAAGTFQLLSYEGPHNGGPKNLVNLNGTLFFSAFGPTLSGNGYDYGMWKSDGPSRARCR
jgi:ELWxxDGT repeat protein